MKHYTNFIIDYKAAISVGYPASLAVKYAQRRMAASKAAEKKD